MAIRREKCMGRQTIGIYGGTIRGKGDNLWRRRWSSRTSFGGTIGGVTVRITLCFFSLLLLTENNKVLVLP